MTPEEKSSLEILALQSLREGALTLQKHPARLHQVQMSYPDLLTHSFTYTQSHVRCLQQLRVPAGYTSSAALAARLSLALAAG